VDSNSLTWLGIPQAVLGTIITVVGSVLVALIAFSAPALTLWWTNLRRPAKQTAVLDFATKRVAFWDQFLKAELAAADSDAAKQDQARQKAHQGIEQALADANQREFSLRRLVVVKQSFPVRRQ
jgi:hypothetical protein